MKRYLNVALFFIWHLRLHSKQAGYLIFKSCLYLELYTMNSVAKNKQNYINILD